VPLAAAAVLWLAATAALVVPVLRAEERAAAGDEHVRTNDLRRAVESFREAGAVLPYNGDYPFRAARILHAGGATDEAVAAYDAAVRANPRSAAYVFARAAAERARPRPDVARVRADYERGLALDPANVPMRLEYAQALESLGSPADARTQYEKALWYNDQLTPDEVERLRPTKLKEVQDAVVRLRV
jgi:tetratricopeptide (TPR) repeat protein